MKYIEKNISQFIETQFPSLYREEGDVLIEFVKSYFEWLESEDQILHKSRRLLEYRDIDRTLEDYIEYFKEKYAKNLDLTTAADKRLFIKNIQDLYKSKGSERSYEILFRTLYNKDVKIYYPGDDILRVSDGEWYEGKYLEITSFVSNIQDYVGKEIRGVKSGASALVENFTQRISNGKVVDVLEISNLRGSFDYGERIYSSSKVGPTLGRSLPNLTGSLSAVAVIDGGANFVVGDVLDVQGKGSKAKAKVSSTIKQQGRVSFFLENGGTGYSLNAISQVYPQVRLTANGSITGTIQEDQLIFQTDGGGTMTANGIVTTVNSSVVTLKQFTGGFAKGENVKSAIKLIMNPVTGTFSNGEFIYQSNGSSNTATGYIVSVVPNSANTAYYVANVTGSFVDSVYSISGNTFQVVGNTSSAQAFLYGVEGGISTGSMNIANVVGGGTGASFRVGEIIDKEVVTLNSDKINQYLNTKFMLFNEGVPATGTVTVTAGANTVTGVGTSFTVDLEVGKYIQVGTGGSKQIRQVSTITNTTFLTTTENYTSAASANVWFIDQVNYLFPKVSSLADVENLNTVLTNALTFAELEIGTIQYLAGINPGTGYSLDPYVNVIEPAIAALEIESPTGFKGDDAIVVGEAGSANGIVLGLSVIDSGLGYEEGERLSLSKSDSAFSVTGSAILKQHGTQEGFWKSTKGFLSSDKYIQDSKYYQEYSYEVQTPLNFDNYKEVVKSLLHTAGTEFFGKFAMVNQDLDTPVNYEQSILANTEIVLSNTYPTERPVFAIDSIQGDTLPTQITVTRTGTSMASYFDVNGDLQIVGNNIPRFEYDRITGVKQGLLIEETRTNFAKNPWCADAVALTNTPPTGWSLAGTGNGVTREIIGSGYDKGIPYVDIRMWGVPTTSHTKDLFFSSTTEIPALAGEYFTSSFYSKMVAGSLNNVNIVRFITGRDSGGGGFLDQVTSSFNTLIGPVGGDLRKYRIVFTRLFSTGTVAYMQGGMRWSFTAFQPVDITIRIAAPQIEKSTFETSNIFPAIASPNSQSTRNGEIMTVTNPSWATGSQGTVYQKVKIKNIHSGNTIPKLLYQAHSNTLFNYSIATSLSALTNAISFQVSDNTNQCTLTSGVVTPNTVIKIATGWNTNDFGFYMNGTHVASDASGTVPPILLFKIGSNYNNDGTRSFNGYIEELKYYPFKFANTQLQALTL